MLTVRVKSYERALWFRDGDLRRVLRPGTHRLWSRLLHPRRDRVEVVRTLDCKFVHPLLDVIVAHPDLSRELTVLDLAEPERALVWKDGRLAHILGPGRHAFWNAPARLEFERFGVGDPRFQHPRLETILAHADATAWLEYVEVDQSAAVLLLVNGQLTETLRAGKHTFWKGTGRLRAITIDQREQLADVSGQEIMTADKVTLRVNLTVGHRVADPVLAATAVADWSQAVYREAQLALRAAIGTRRLDDLLADKESVGGDLRAVLAPRIAEFGVEIRSVGLKDIVLPGEMRTILNQVIEAEKRAQAEIIRRREETAAARSQANTARLLAENPALARLRELELLREVLAGTSATFVFGAGDVADQVRALVSKPSLTN